MNKWLKLSDGVYLFGQGGINRVEPIDQRDTSRTYIYITELYSGLVKVATVKESVDEIENLLYNNQT